MTDALEDDNVLFVDRLLRQGTRTEGIKPSPTDAARILPIPVLEADLREYLQLAIVLEAVAGSGPFSLLSLESDIDQLLSRLREEDRAIRARLRDTAPGAFEHRLTEIRREAAALDATRARPTGGTWRLARVVDGLQSESRPTVFGDLVSIEDVTADNEGGTATIRVKLDAEGCAERYLARWSFSAPVDWLPEQGGIDVTLGLERSGGGTCRYALYAAELEARGSAGARPLSFQSLPKPGLQATSTQALSSARIGGTWKGASAGTARIAVDPKTLRGGAYQSAYFFINIMARSNRGKEGVAHYRVAYGYAPN